MTGGTPVGMESMQTSGFAGFFFFLVSLAGEGEGSGARSGGDPLSLNKD